VAIVAAKLQERARVLETGSKRQRASEEREEGKEIIL
jgi:hypothetical protein